MHVCRGFTSLEAALQDAQACLSATSLPAPVSAPALRISREGLQHCPSREEWQHTMKGVHGNLSVSSDAVTNLASQKPGIAPCSV